MNTPRHHHQTAPAQWAHATWTWSSAVLLSALLVSPVGAGTLLHLLRLHLPAVVQAAERNEIAAPSQESVPRRKSEEEPPAVSADAHAAPDADPSVTPVGDIAPVVSLVTMSFSATVCPPPVPRPFDDRLRSIVRSHRVPRAPPV